MASDSPGVLNIMLLMVLIVYPLVSRIIHTKSPRFGKGGARMKLCVQTTSTRSLTTTCISHRKQYDFYDAVRTSRGLVA